MDFRKVKVRSIKLCYQNDIRRLPLETLKKMSGDSSTLDNLKALVTKTFPSLNGREFHLKYTDDESDTITVTTNDELEEAFAVADFQSANVARFDIVALTELFTSLEKPSPAETQTNVAVHHNVICDGCDMQPIVGDRFKCSVRSDFDLCNGCEQKDTSPHPYLKIKDSSQAPAAVMTILRPNQAGAASGPCAVRQALAEKIQQVEAMCGDKVVACAAGAYGGGTNNGGACAASPEELVQVPGDASIVRLECLSSSRDFGPFRLLRKPNGTVVFLRIQPNGASERKPNKPWKSGGCLRIGKKGTMDMNGKGGDWASYHVEACTDGADQIPNGMVRLTCGNRKLRLANVNGRLVGVPSSQIGPHTHFRIHETEVGKSVAKKENDSKSNTVAEDTGAATLSNDEALAKELQAAANLPVPMASFVEDMTVPDGSAISPGEQFDKIWRIRNDGDTPFPEGCRIVHVGGDLLSAPSDGVNVGGFAKQPLEEFDVAVPCVAPASPGKYVSYWRLVTPAGAEFGHRLWIDISVTEMESKEGPSANDLCASSSLGVVPPQPPAATKNDDAGPASSAPVVSEGGAASDAVDESSGDSDKWEKIEVPSKAYSTSNPFLGEPESETNENENGQSGAASPGQDLSASMEGAIAAGSELNEAGLTESVAAVIQATQFDENVSKWNTAVTKITEMGFDDITTIISLLEKHATPENFETKLQVIVGELLSGMPVLN